MYFFLLINKNISFWDFRGTYKNILGPVSFRNTCLLDTDDILSWGNSGIITSKKNKKLSFLMLQKHFFMSYFDKFHRRKKAAEFGSTINMYGISSLTRRTDVQ